MKMLFRDHAGRLRSGWRILLQFFCFLIVLIIIQTLQNAAMESQSILLFCLGSVLYLAGSACIFWAFARWIDRRKLGDYGLHIKREWWLDVAAGSIIGIFNLTLVVLVESGLGWARFNLDPQSAFEGPFPLIAAAVLLNLLAVGIGEEMTFRGYQVRNLAEGFEGFLGSKKAVGTALVLTSGLFGLAHMLNPNATILSGLNTILAGLTFGLAYILTGELAIPIGIHIAWGFFEGFVYGFPNSGMPPSSWLMSNQVGGPDLWTGGIYGPEGGLLVTGLLVIDALIVIIWLKMRRRWRSPLHHSL